MEMFQEWLVSPVTKKVFHKLQLEKEDMKDGLVYDNYEKPEVVKGLCRAIDKLVQIQYEDIFDGKPSK